MRSMFFILLLALVLAPSAHAEINAMQCPPPPAGQSLSDFDIYDQSGDDKEYLTQDDDGWDLDSYHMDGHRIFLACHYSNGKTKKLEIPGNLDMCSPVGDNVICR